MAILDAATKFATQKRIEEIYATAPDEEAANLQIAREAAEAFGADAADALSQATESAFTPTEIREMSSAADFDLPTYSDPSLDVQYQYDPDASLGANIEELQKEITRLSGEIASRPYEEYGGERVVGFTEEEQAARDELLRLTGLALGFPGVEQALEIAKGVGAYEAPLLRDVNLEPYRSQYQEGVTDIALRELDKQRQLRQQGVSEQAIRAGAFGGSRQGIVESELEKTYAQQAADVAAQGALAGEQYAQRGALADLAAQRAEPGVQLQGAAAMAGLSDQLRQMGYTDAEIARQLGTEDRALLQAEADIGYEDYLTALAFPSQQLGYLMAPLTMQLPEQVDDASFIQNLLGGIGYGTELIGALGRGGIIGGSGSGALFENPFGFGRS